jgi:hypothetical protein
MRNGVRLILSVAGLVLLGASAMPANAQLPVFPAARYYGSVSVFGLPQGAGTVTVQNSAGGFCGSGNIAVGTYSVDIQAYAGCGGPLSFFVNGQQADQTSIVPNNLSGAVMLNLTVSGGCPYVFNPQLYPCVGPTPFTAPPPPPFGSLYTPPPSPFSGQITVTYQPGWNLIAGPNGAVPAGIAGALFTFQPGDSSYETLPGNAPMQAGFGYWALLSAPLNVTFSGGGSPAITRTIPPGQYAMIGNPFARPATISGANVSYIYTPGAGYQPSTTLQPGQGAWAQGGPSGQVIIQST